MYFGVLHKHKTGQGYSKCWQGWKCSLHTTLVIGQMLSYPTTAQMALRCAQSNTIFNNCMCSHIHCRASFLLQFHAARINCILVEIAFRGQQPLKITHIEILWEERFSYAELEMHSTSCACLLSLTAVLLHNYIRKFTYWSPQFDPDLCHCWWWIFISPMLPTQVDW